VGGEEREGEGKASSSLCQLHEALLRGGRDTVVQLREVRLLCSGLLRSERRLADRRESIRTQRSLVNVIVEAAEKNDPLQIQIEDIGESAVD
jgi:hypothetical protein